MARRSRKQAVQVNMDSDEEFTFSSEEDEDFEDERLHFEDRIDPVEDTNDWIAVITVITLTVCGLEHVICNIGGVCWILFIAIMVTSTAAISLTVHRCSPRTHRTGDALRRRKKGRVCSPSKNMDADYEGKNHHPATTATDSSSALSVRFVGMQNWVLRINPDDTKVTDQMEISKGPKKNQPEPLMVFLIRKLVNFDCQNY
ncbi:uncharacterized protein LOC127506821 [Ctenopharyngodon idella]|uniref:uncharacterized protein LOC127506821 n=1 Tax=Ctenopharyngodon idella TaxID=7959 RepID=UPI00222E2104|nr:uncharacterized protein LOC127506821 [Ctenopharyngodon idella]